MQVAMNKMGNKLREDELHELIATADVDGNGTIDYEEFVAATVNLNKLEKEEHCMQVCPAAALAHTACLPACDTLACRFLLLLLLMLLLGRLCAWT